MFCKNCGNAMNENQAICLNCGVKKGEGNKFCASCGAATSIGNEFCMNCGASLKKTSDLNGQDKIVMILICFFLGGIGIHNFMMGETKKGIFKIIMCFVCGLSEIFALIDLIKIAMDKYVADPTKLI